MSKDLVIVESPTKAKTITKFLKGAYTVKSSYGHIRDLPKKDIGIDVNNNFEPTYVVEGEDKKKVVDELKKLSKNAKTIYFATDEDREGEAIAWHLVALLNPKKEQIKRITFHEITKPAIEEALSHPRSIDEKRVYAQQARRILDRLVGYELSPFLWKKVARGLSAGRVQSVAVRLIVVREREIMQFEAREYWTIDAIFSKDTRPLPGNYDPKQLPEGFFSAKLHAINSGSLDKFEIGDEAHAKKILAALVSGQYTITSIDQKETKKNPPAPFTTSTLQQESNRKLGYSSLQTMRLAQQLYEGIDVGSEGEVGLITYMRTDSVNLSTKFTADAREYLKKNIGDEYALSSARVFKTKSKTAQEAHEAIRPTEASRTPESIKQYLSAQQYKLYDLIWKRAVASQMPEAVMNNTALDISTASDATYTFRATGQTIAFAGYLKLYPASQRENTLPVFKKGDPAHQARIEPNQHFTEPPARYSDASLVKALEEYDIGRPSTYAPTISTIEKRGYVERIENRRLKPTDMAFLVTDVLTDHFPKIVDYKFTARMEEELDEIAEGKIDWERAVRDFYEPFKANLIDKTENLKREDIIQIRGLGIDPKTGLAVFAKTGRFGPYVQLGEWKEEQKDKKKGKGKKAKKEKLKSASLKSDQSVETITIEEALELLKLPRTLGKNKDNEDVIANTGRFGPYLKAGKTTASLSEEHDPYTITLETALEVLKTADEQKKKLREPIAELGEDPNSKGAIQVKHGRFGPYVTDGITNKSLSKGTDPKSVTREDAITMLEGKRKNPGRGRRGKTPKA